MEKEVEKVDVTINGYDIFFCNEDDFSKGDEHIHDTSLKLLHDVFEDTFVKTNGMAIQFVKDIRFDQQDQMWILDDTKTIAYIKLHSVAAFCQIENAVRDEGESKITPQQVLDAMLHSYSFF